jgi:hypothetical protein
MVAVLAGKAVELSVQLAPLLVEMTNSPGSVGVEIPPSFVPTARHVVVVGKQATESNSVFIPVVGAPTHVAPPSTVCRRPSPTERHDELWHAIEVPIPM